MRRLGETGGTPTEDRDRMKRLFALGLKDAIKDTNFQLSQHDRTFLQDMADALRDNPYFEPSFGQVAKAQDLYDRYIL